MLSFFSESPFMPHGHCFLWQKDILSLHVISDAVIALSYYSIPIALYMFAIRRKDFKYRSLLFMFAFFIIACGTTHLMTIWNFWHTHYWLSGGIKATTALISAATAVAIWPLLPKLMTIPNPRELEASRETLKDLKHKMLVLVNHSERSNEDPEMAVVETAVKSYIDDLKNSQVLLQQANQSYIKFLTTMSHEIRTPLTGINGYVDRLRVDQSISENTQDILERIKGASDHLGQLLNDILDLSKIESGKLEIDNELVPITEVVNHVSSIVAGNMKPGVDLKVTLQNQIPSHVHADPVRLRQILFNLLNNAVKFTDRGTIHLELSYHPDVATPFGVGRLDFSVIDTGIGIPPDQTAKLFKAFSQVDTSLSRRSSGTGLGLALSRQLAVLMKGTIDLDKSAPGLGSTFRFSLHVPKDQQGTLFSSLAAAESENGSHITSEQIQGRLADKKILLVEDGVDNQNIVSYFLKLAGAHVDIAENGEEGMNMALKKPYDAVLMDIQMPIMDGYSALKALQGMEYDRPIIALTAHAMRSERIRCRDEGFSGYLSKPIDVELLINTLEKFTA